MSGERGVLGERTERRLRDVSRFLPPGRESLYCALAFCLGDCEALFAFCGLWLTSPSLCGDSWADRHDNDNVYHSKSLSLYRTPLPLFVGTLERCLFCLQAMVGTGQLTYQG